MVSIKAVAAAAAVSQGTVSHVLNHPERVAEATKERVHAAMRELGYVRNSAARQLRLGVSSTFGLIVNNDWNPFFNELARAIEDEVQDRGWNLVVARSGMEADRERAHLEAFEQHRFRGIFIVPTEPASLPAIEAVYHRGTPCVLVDWNTDASALPSVGIDDVRGGVLAGRHLVQTGRRRLLFAGNPERLRHAADRLAGFRRGAAVAPDATVSVVDVPGLNVRSGREVGRRVVDLPAAERPDGIFCANDLVALGAMRELVAGGLCIPNDISLVGYDDVDFAEQALVPLTTVRQYPYEVGRLAASWLVEESGPSADPPARVMLEPVLIERESSGRGHGREVGRPACAQGAE